MDLLLMGKTSRAHGPLTLDDLQADSAMTLYREKRFVVTQGFVEQSHLIGLFIVFILLILIVNTAMIIFILASKAMRTNSRHILIISVCFGDLLMGIFVLPSLLSLGMRHGEKIQDCTTFYAMRLFADFLIPCVTTLAMLSLNVDYILRLTYSAYAEGGTRVCVIVSLLLLPWLLSCVLLIPLYVGGLDKTEGIWWETCAINLDGYMSRTLVIVSFFPQASLLLVCNIAVSVLYLTRRESYSLDVTGERIRAPVDICLASFATILLYTPVFLLTLLTTEGYLGCRSAEECRNLNVMATTAIWLIFTKSWFLPFCWLTCRDTRTCIRHIFYCC